MAAALKNNIQSHRLVVGKDFTEVGNVLDVYALAQVNQIVKMVDYSNCADNLSYFSHFCTQMWAVDEIQFLSPYTPDVTLDKDPIVYSMPRSGTHVAMDVYNVKHYLHCESWGVDSKVLVHLLQSKNIIGVSRNSFLDFVCSKEINKRSGVTMISNTHNYEKNVEIAKEINPFYVDLGRIANYLDEAANYYNQLLVLRRIVGKQVSFSLLEDLIQQPNLTFVKNPYQHDKLISNYQELSSAIKRKYQPAYQYMTNQVIKYCGLTLCGNSTSASSVNKYI